MRSGIPDGDGGGQKNGNLRKAHRDRRDAMTREDAAERSARICRQLLQADWYPGCRTIYGYYPLGREADCRAFLWQALSDGKQVALPRMWATDLRRTAGAGSGTEDGGRQADGAGGFGMDFYRITAPDQVAEGSFHVMEPLPGCALSEEESAVVLVPGVVFDENGGRMGYGKGCYDRYFARFPGLYRVGIAYEHQMEKRIPQKTTDVKMSEVCTEKRRMVCARGTRRPG